VPNAAYGLADVARVARLGKVALDPRCLRCQTAQQAGVEVTSKMMAGAGGGVSPKVAGTRLPWSSEIQGSVNATIAAGDLVGLFGISEAYRLPRGRHPP